MKTVLAATAAFSMFCACAVHADWTDASASEEMSRTFEQRWGGQMPVVRVPHRDFDRPRFEMPSMDRGTFGRWPSPGRTDDGIVRCAAIGCEDGLPKGDLILDLQ